jgi:hypothetical protein
MPGTWKALKHIYGKCWTLGSNEWENPFL